MSVAGASSRCGVGTLGETASTESGANTFPPFPSGRHRSSTVNGTALSDRKSTRLNSSHRTISYAVFCLKKKKPCLPVVRLQHPSYLTPPLSYARDVGPVASPVSPPVHTRGPGITLSCPTPPLTRRGSLT